MMVAFMDIIAYINANILPKYYIKTDIDIRLAYYYTALQIDAKFEALSLENKGEWKSSVYTFGDIATTYTDPKNGWTVFVNDTNTIWRFVGESLTWEKVKFTPPLASQTQDGQLSKEDYLKLLEIEPKATKNSSDAFLLDRSNHTGEQAINTITDLSSTIVDIQNSINAKENNLGRPSANGVFVLTRDSNGTTNWVEVELGTGGTIGGGGALTRTSVNYLVNSPGTLVDVFSVDLISSSKSFFHQRLVVTNNSIDILATIQVKRVENSIYNIIGSTNLLPGELGVFRLDELMKFTIQCEGDNVSLDYITVTG